MEELKFIHYRPGVHGQEREFKWVTAVKREGPYGTSFWGFCSFEKTAIERWSLWLSLASPEAAVIGDIRDFAWSVTELEF